MAPRTTGSTATKAAPRRRPAKATEPLRVVEMTSEEEERIARKTPVELSLQERVYRLLTGWGRGETAEASDRGEVKAPDVARDGLTLDELGRLLGERARSAYRWGRHDEAHAQNVMVRNAIDAARREGVAGALLLATNELEPIIALIASRDVEKKATGVTALVALTADLAQTMEKVHGGLGKLGELELG